LLNQIKEFEYLQENPTYQQDWDAAFWGYQEKKDNFFPIPEEVRKRNSITLEEIGQFVNSPMGFALAKKYDLLYAYYYGLSLGEQLKAIHDVDADNYVPIFSFWLLPCTVKVIPHAPSQWLDSERRNEIRLEQIREGLPPGQFLERIDALKDKTPHLRENKYLKVEIDITQTDTKIFTDLKAILGYYRNQIDRGRQEKKSRPHYDPLKVWKLVVDNLGKTPPENQEEKSVLWQVAGELDSDQNAYDIWSEEPQTIYREDSQQEIYKKLQKAYQIARRKILSFTSSKK